MAKGLSLKFSDNGFMTRLRLFYKRTRGNNAAILRSQGRLLARDLAFQTQPFGKDKSAQELGERAVEREIRRVYKSAGEVALSDKLSYAIRNAPMAGARAAYARRFGQPTQNPDQAARAFVWLVQRGKYGEARELLKRVGVTEQEITSIPIGKMDGGEAHQSVRYGARKKVPRNQLPLRIVSDRQIKSYVNKIRKNVGIAKAGWASGARLLGGTRGILKWVLRNMGKGGGGYVIDQADHPSSPKITLVNNVPWVGKNLNEAQKESAVKIQYDKMLQAIDKAMRAEARLAKIS